MTRSLHPLALALAALLSWAGREAAAQTAAAASPVLRLEALGPGGGTISEPFGQAGCGKLAKAPYTRPIIYFGTCATSLAPGTVVQLTATPTEGSIFGGWLGDCAGTSPTCTITMGGDRSAAAIFNTPVERYGDPPPQNPFEKVVSVTVLVAGTGSGTVELYPGNRCSVTNGRLDAGECEMVVQAGTAVALVPRASPGSVVGGCSATCTFQIFANTVVTVTFNRQAQATVAVGGTGTGSGSVTSTPAGIACTIANGVAAAGCASTFLAGSSVTLAATAASGSTFTGWSGACGGATCTVAVPSSGAVSATAAFARHPTLSVVGDGSGDGTVRSTPAGIDCVIADGRADGSDPGRRPCAAILPPGSAVVLDAAASAGSRFVGWSGACTGTGSCRVTLTQSTAAAATFARLATVTVVAAGRGSGRITSTPAGIDCAVSAGALDPTPCRGEFPIGSAITLTPTTAATSAFAGWAGACTGAGRCVVAVTGATAVGVTLSVLPAPTLAATDLLTGVGLTNDDRLLLDQLGNRDGGFDVGDLLAYLDRTGQRLDPAMAARVLALPTTARRPIP